MAKHDRRGEIRRRRQRGHKLDVLRQRYASAKTDGERRKVLAKAQRVSPRLSEEQFLERVPGQS